jgi:hypothetical protein
VRGETELLALLVRTGYADLRAREIDRTDVSLSLPLVTLRISHVELFLSMSGRASVSRFRIGRLKIPGDINATNDTRREIAVGRGMISWNAAAICWQSH